MAKKKKIEEINLLPQEEFEASTLGRALKWLLSTFRYIVIATEMVVMLAFLSRFWLDAKSGDLTDAINQKKAIVASYKTFEDEFRQTQAKLQTFASFAGSSSNISPVITDISSKIPGDITLTDVSMDKGKLQITADTGNESSATVFVNNLSSSSFLKDVTLSSIESEQSGTNLSIVVTATVKGAGSGN